ncbi:MAG: hypothetical protein IPN76_16600 [Saprospiraceae bacterium]|nr:hypothetical protein [Saprospiraceae bacterium]
MKNILYTLILLSIHAKAQVPSNVAPLDFYQYGVVLEIPGMKTVEVQKDIPYQTNDKGSLYLDLYRPPQLKKTEKRPAIIFLNAIGDEAGKAKVKEWGIYASWPRLIAANGYIGISMEADPEHIQQSIEGLFDFIAKNAHQYQIDADRLGVYASSANVRGAMAYLMGQTASPGIKAAVLFYGWPPSGPYRKDLPVMAIIAETDARPGSYDELWKEVLTNKAPWTLKMASGLTHAFDAFCDNDAARRVILEALAFWKTQLDPVPQPTWAPSTGREVIALRYTNDHEQLLPKLKALADQYPNDESVQSTYAEALVQAQQFAEAEKIYCTLLEKAPKSHNARISLIVTLCKQGKVATAENQIAQLLQSDQLDASTYSNLGFYLLQLEKAADAAKYYEIALASQPDGFDYYHLACAYALNNQADKAIGALEKAIGYGYGQKKQLENDPRLAQLMADKRFQALVEQLK